MRRTTRQREAILRFLKNTRTHPTVDVIYEGIKKELPNISLGTVYRNLKILQESGQVNEVQLQDNLGRYEARINDHYHFRCETCGRVMDIEGQVDTGLNGRVAEKTGLKINSHTLEFRGLCQDCQSK